MYKHSIENTDCNQERVYFSTFLASDLFNCSVPKSQRGFSPKTTIGLSITDTNMKDVSKEYGVIIQPPKGEQIYCPKDCSKLAEKKCKCESLELFDVKNQLLNLFSNSGIKYVANFYALENWKFYQDFNFYCILVLFSTLIITIFLIEKYYKRYTIIKKKAVYKTREALGIAFLVKLLIN